MTTKTTRTARLISFRTAPKIEVSENADGTYSAIWGDNADSDDFNIPTFDGKAICRDIPACEVEIA